MSSSQILGAFEGGSQECYIAPLSTWLASQISLRHFLSLWFIFFFNQRPQFLRATRQVGAWTDEGKSIPDPGNTVQSACPPDKDQSAVSREVGSSSTFHFSRKAYFCTVWCLPLVNSRTVSSLVIISHLTWVEYFTIVLHHLERSFLTTRLDYVLFCILMVICSSPIIILTIFYCR